MEVLTNYSQTSYPYLPNFMANARQHVRAVRYLKHVKSNAERDVVCRRERIIGENILPKKWIEKMTYINPDRSLFSQSDKAETLYRYGIESLDIDKLEGIQYGIDVFKNLTMREIVFLAYRTVDLAIKRGCANMCLHCLHAAKPADKTELSFMPFEDFKKIADGFAKITKRINTVLENDKMLHFIGEKNDIYDTDAVETALFYDSDGMNVIAKDKYGKEYDYVDLAEIFYNATGKFMLFDTAGWNPKNKVLQQRAEKYAKYFSQPDIDKKFQYNLSINTFNPLYAKSYELGYRPGIENDLTNPDIKRGKAVYDKYIERVANMIATIGITDHANLLMTFATKYEKNMDGMYLSDLKLILKDVEKKCNEILKENYPADEYIRKSKNVKKLISDSIARAEDRNIEPRCVYKGNYKKLYNSRNPKYPREDTRITLEIPDINTLSLKEYKSFLRYYTAVIDTNGELYYQRYDISVRSMDKELKLSTNGKKTPKITNLEHRTYV